jgi:hypothetical protein
VTGSERLAGHFSVEASARLIRHYRYTEERLMRILGGWIALTPELPAKLLFGRHVWDCAQHADLWGKRLPELRAPAQQSEPSSERFVRFMDLLESAEDRRQTAERVTGAYRVLKPHLIAVYERHLAAANPVYEPPTRRILQRCIEEERRHATAGAVVIAALFAEGESRRRVAEWERRLRDALGEAGGVTGEDRPVPMAPVEADRGRAGTDVVALGSAFHPDTVPDDLAAVVNAHRSALVAGDLARAATDVDVPARGAVLEEYGKLPRSLRACELVAMAKIGEYRVVKLHLRGQSGSSTLQLQWRRGAEGWRVVAAELAVAEPPRP